MKKKPFDPFPLLQRCAALVCRAVQEVKSGLYAGSTLQALDRAAVNLREMLSAAFITPLEREDLYLLCWQCCKQGYDIFSTPLSTQEYALLECCAQKQAALFNLLPAFHMPQPIYSACTALHHSAAAMRHAIGVNTPQKLALCNHFEDMSRLMEYVILKNS